MLVQGAEQTRILNMLKIKKNYLPKFKKKFLDFYIQTKQGKK